MPDSNYLYSLVDLLMAGFRRELFQGGVRIAKLTAWGDTDPIQLRRQLVHCFNRICDKVIPTVLEMPPWARCRCLRSCRSAQKRLPYPI